MPLMLDTPPVSMPVRHHVPGTVSHVRRAVLHHQSLFADPNAAQYVLDELYLQARIHDVELHAVVVRPDRYDILVSHTSARSTARFLCVANKAISGTLRPKSWSSTFWNGDRPGIDLVTREPEVMADKLLELLHGADRGLAEALLTELEGGPGDACARADVGPVLLVRVTALKGRTARDRRAFVGRVCEGLRAMLGEKIDDQSSVTGMPGSEEPAPSPRRRRPRLFGHLPATLTTMAQVWLRFQRAYRQAAERLRDLKPIVSALGFPNHSLGPPVPTPP